MRSTKTRQKVNLAGLYQLGLAILTLSLIAASGWPSLAQSGRSQPQPQEEPSASKALSRAQEPKKDRRLPAAFVVATAAPDHHLSPGFYPGYSLPTSSEYHVRGGCLNELKSIPGTKVIEDEDIERWEARQTALAEDKAWVIWMELKWETTTGSRDSSPFRLRYLLFEPGTAKIAASGYGNGVRKTWGSDPKRTTPEEQLREAGRDIARQVLSELGGER